MYSCVIFDLDGTLLNTLADLAAAGNHALEALELPTHEVEAYKTFIGNGIPNLIRRMLPEGSEEALQKEALRLFSDHYAAHHSDRTKPYDGIPALLDTLHRRGVKIAVVSNKAHVFSVELIRRFFGETVGPVYGTGNDLPRKPDPTAVFRVMEEMGVTKPETLYVGDSDVDMFTARNAGLDACGVLWGFRSKNVLAESGARFLAKNAEELERIILA
ncbi:MAG: HAD-IIIA family hydrolase [Oscillospiraceae bacterium]|nr:HAD-IIIA family hydrolase [Oscillospiraceae bacterium]